MLIKSFITKLTNFSLAGLFKQIPVVNTISTNPEDKAISSVFDIYQSFFSPADLSVHDLEIIITQSLANSSSLLFLLSTGSI